MHGARGRAVDAVHCQPDVQGPGHRPGAAAPAASPAHRRRGPRQEAADRGLRRAAPIPVQRRGAARGVRALRGRDAGAGRGRHQIHAVRRPLQEADGGLDRRGLGPDRAPALREAPAGAGRPPTDLHLSDAAQRPVCERRDQAQGRRGPGRRGRLRDAAADRCDQEEAGVRVCQHPRPVRRPDIGKAACAPGESKG